MTAAAANARLVELLRAGLARADSLQLDGVRLVAYPDADKPELVMLLHAYLWDTAAPYDEQWHRSPGKIMTLWAELLDIEEPIRKRLKPLRVDLVKALTSRKMACRTHPQSVPILVRPFTGTGAAPVHPGLSSRMSTANRFGS